MPQRPPTLHTSRSVDRHNQYDKWRVSSTERGYDYKWQRVRKLKLSLNPLCELCDVNDVVTEASIVHHIKHVDTNPELRLTMSNLTSVCPSCHQQLHTNDDKLQS